jgi:cell division septum initiation protein DivIVA
VSHDSLPESLELPLEGLPQVFRGYDRQAAEELFAAAKSRYRELFEERQALQRRVESLERASAESEQRLSAELERLRVELDAQREREEVLKDELEKTNRALATHERRELVVGEMLEGAKRTAAKLKADARAEASKTLKKSREREADLTRGAKEAMQSARKQAAKIRADARAEAKKRLEQARTRDAERHRQAEERLTQMQEAYAHLEQAADRFRNDLSDLLLEALAGLGLPRPDAAETTDRTAPGAEATDNVEQPGVGAVGSPGPPLEAAALASSLAEFIRARVQGHSGHESEEESSPRISRPSRARR